MSCPYPVSEQCGHNGLQVLQCYNNKGKSQEAGKNGTYGIYSSHMLKTLVPSVSLLNSLYPPLGLYLASFKMKGTKPPAFQSISSIKMRFTFIGTICFCG